MKRKIFIRLALYPVILGMLIVVILNIWVVGTTYDKVYTDISVVPINKVGLVLGTSNKLISGDTNKYFYQRIQVAVELYHANKIEHILVSGDNRSQYYNEPLMMKKALESEGIPPERIHMDFAGLRTLDSIIRGKLIFGQGGFTIITQPFHSYRALFIAEKHGIKAVAMVSADTEFGRGLKSKFREIFARTVAVWDLLVLNKMPRHLGDEEEIN